jgi:hypothetical protein
MVVVDVQVGGWCSVQPKQVNNCFVPLVRNTASIMAASVGCWVRRRANGFVGTPYVQQYNTCKAQYMRLSLIVCKKPSTAYKHEDHHYSTSSRYKATCWSTNRSIRLPCSRRHGHVFSALVPCQWEPSKKNCPSARWFGSTRLLLPTWHNKRLFPLLRREDD